MNTVLTKPLTSKQTIGQMVADRPSRAALFERLGLDYCCGGKNQLETACQEKALNLSAVMRELQECDARVDGEPEADWTAAPLEALVDHILVAHHAYLKDALPRLTLLIDKVDKAHGDSHPDLGELAATFSALRRELEHHTNTEESVVFPLIRSLESGSSQYRVPSSTFRDSIRTMESEHDRAGAELGKIRSLANDYVPPADACNTFRAMLDGLAELESDMHRHVHKENSILFPRAAELEALLATI